MSNGNIASDLPFTDPYGAYMTRTPEFTFHDTPIPAFTVEALSAFADETGALTGDLDLTVTGDPKFAEIFLFSSVAKFESTGDAIPVAQLRWIDSTGTTLYYSPVYQIGGVREFTRKEWRMPPAVGKFTTVRLSLRIPEGVRLFVRELRLKPNQTRRERNIGIRYHGHTGFPGYIAGNTLLSFQTCAEMGFGSCITIPKFTKDGVGVCLHDDNPIQRELSLPGGAIPSPGSSFDKPVWDYTWDELLGLDAGTTKTPLRAAAKVPTLEDYFRTCSLTGMQPIFSVHPPLTREQWLTVKELLTKYRLLDQFWVKSNQPEVHRLCAEIFDDSIAGYIFLQGVKESWDPDEMAVACGLDKHRHTIVVEYFALNGTGITEKKIRTARQEGYPVSAACIRGGISGVHMQKLIDLGVSEFTLDFHCSMGLDW